MLHINVPFHNARTVQWDRDASVSFIEIIATDAKMVPWRADIQYPNVRLGTIAYDNGHRAVLSLSIFPPEIHNSHSVRVMFGHQ